MAYYKITTDKKGMLKAKIQTYAKDISGKSKLFTKTVYNTDGLPENKFKRFVERQTFDFEDELEEQYEKALLQAQQEPEEHIPTFSELMDEWIETIHENLSVNYYEHAKNVAERFYAFLKEKDLYDKSLTEIRVRDVQLFLNQLSSCRTINTGLSELKTPLPKTVSFRKLAADKILPRNTSYNLNHNNARILTSTAKQICDVYNLNFNTYFREIIETKQYSPETVKGYRRVLRTVFNEAVRYEWITTNPVCRTKINSGNSNTSLQAVTEKAVFSIREMKEFLKALNSLDEELINKKVMVKLMLLTGVRTAELHGLKWCDIDFENKLLYIKRNRLYSGEIGVYEKAPKTKTSEREIPIPDELLKDLYEYMDWFRKADINFDSKLDQYYLASNEFREPEYPHSIGHWLKKFEEQNGFKLVSNHGLRHTYCSLLLAQNVPIQTVSKYMGHSDSSITLQVYSHFIPDTQERVFNAINTILNDD